MQTYTWQVKKYPEEEDTRPDLGTLCPLCKGEGSRLTLDERGDERQRLCDGCWGKKRVSGDELLRARRLAGE
jgi:hypothetical protein